mgnify:CR=1 FL=1
MKVVAWDRDHVQMLDQRRLPGTVVTLDLHTVEAVADGIRSMAVRGAPAIGIAAAYGLALSARSVSAESTAQWRAAFQADRDLLHATRPTAVNLAWALERCGRVADSVLSETAGQPFADVRARLEEALLEEARHIDREDEWMCRRMGDFGAELVPSGARILTHCNAGGLATGGYGTAVGVIRSAWARHENVRVYVDETRPLLQGARLTAWELSKEKIPYTLITDNMAGWFMKQGKIDLAVVGADRICANGDVANKIGTYSVAVLCHHHKIPLYVAAPFSTIDLSLACGELIPIEQRDPAEVTHLHGVRTAPDDAAAANPAFDVTPAALISAIITERGVLRPPYSESLARAAAAPPPMPADA